VLDERASTGAMQHFCQVGAHSRSFARSKNYDSRVVCSHRGLIVASPDTFGNGKARFIEILQRKR